MSEQTVSQADNLHNNSGKTLRNNPNNNQHSERSQQLDKQINHIEHLEQSQNSKQWPIISQPLNLPSIDNLRDMGGIATQDGRVIRPHMLFRSANLHKASAHDLHALDSLGLRNVIDLRTKQEKRFEEDQLMQNWQYYWLPVFSETQEASKQLEGIFKDPGTFIESIYPQMIRSQMAVDCWKQCFALLLNESGAFLWHCTQGKDRTGALAALILAALNVDEETIVADYLETNRFMSTETPKFAEKIEKLVGRRIDGDINQFLVAAPAYIHAFLDAAAEYGGLRGFLHEKVGLSDADFERLRERFTQAADSADSVGSTEFAATE